MLHAGSSSSSSSSSNGAGGFITRNSNSVDGIVNSQIVVGDDSGNVAVIDDSPTNYYDSVDNNDYDDYENDLDDQDDY